MYLTYKIARGTLKGILSQAAPWQLFIGAFIGTMLGFVAMWPATQGPNPLWFALLILGVMINCHLGSLLVFLGIGKLLVKILAGPAIVVGQGMEGFAQKAADVPVLYASLLSHTGYLGRTVLGLCFGLLFAILLAWFAQWFRRYVKAKLAANAALAKAGKLADRPIFVRIGCWFLGL